MAEASSQAGNAAYKASKLTEACILYAKAAKLDPKEPKYASNLSAAQYEAGQYAQTIDSIVLSWKALSARNQPSSIPLSDPLAFKLATRLAKAKINGIFKGSISLHQKTGSKSAKQERASMDIENAIENFAMSPRHDETDAKVKDMKVAWDQWLAARERCSKHDMEECERVKEQARKRLRSLRIFKATSDPAMEFFRFGHDEPQSLMNGLMGQMDDFVMDIQAYTEDEHPAFAFLFGGSGDARHVFATIIHFADFANETSSEMPVDWTSAHFTLVDIHPATLARVTVMFAILQRLLVHRTNQDKKKVAELYGTLFYLFTTIFMPDYCRQIIMEVAQELVDELPKGTHYVCRCLHVNEQSLPAIIDVLRYWTKPLDKTYKGFLRRNPKLSSCKKALEMQNLKKSPTNDGTPGPDHVNYVMESLMGLPSSKTSNTEGRKAMGDPYEDAYGEADVYDRAKILLPPKVLLPRHPALATVVKAYNEVSPIAWAALAKEVEESWQPNPTIFDEVSTENFDFGAGMGYPGINGSPYDHIHSFARFCKDYERRPSAKRASRNTGYAIMSQFFELTVEAIWTLRNVLKIEVVLGDVITGVPKLLADDLGSRPKEFPTKYSRMFLSNVPDYTQGALNTAVHLARHCEPESLLMSNCLLNTGIFRTIREQVFTYSYLSSQEFPRFLGCRVISELNNAFDDICLETHVIPKPIGELATKKELHSWLSLVLLCTLVNGKAINPPMKVELPNNIQAFFHLLVYLHHVGFPSHWLGDFVQSMVSDNMISDMVPYEQTLPVPLSAAEARTVARKVHLAAWRTELEVILASVASALPFSVAIPEEYPSLEDIKIFKASKVEFKNWRRAGSDMRTMSLSSPFVKAAGLLFYRGANDTKRDAIVHQLRSIIEGIGEMLDIEAQFVLAPENVNLHTGEVSWKMGRAWHEKMKAEGWKMSVFRTDMEVTVSEPVKATNWLLIS